MYAIIETGGKQLWVVPGETVKVEKLEVEQGAKLTFNALWAVGDAPEGQEPVSTRTAKVTARPARLAVWRLAASVASASVSKRRVPAIPPSPAPPLREGNATVAV